MKINLTIRNDADAVRAISLLSMYVHDGEAAQPAAMQEPASTATPAPAPTPVAAETIPESVAGVELDANNTPWIADVHATTKTKDRNGVWKKKRGIDEEVLKEREAAARAEIAATPPATVPSADPVAAMPTEAPAEPAQAALPMEGMQPTVSMDDVHGAWAEAMQAGKVTVEEAMAMYVSIGVDPSQLANNETERSKLYSHLKSL